MIIGLTLGLIVIFLLHFGLVLGLNASYHLGLILKQGLVLNLGLGLDR